MARLRANKKRSYLLFRNDTVKSTMTCVKWLMKLLKCLNWFHSFSLNKFLDFSISARNKVASDQKQFRISRFQIKIISIPETFFWTNIVSSEHNIFDLFWFKSLCYFKTLANPTLLLNMSKPLFLCDKHLYQKTNF